MSKIESKLISKPWGHELIWGEIEGFCIGKTINIKHGHRLSRQYHEKKEEIIHVVEGNLRLEIGENPDGSPGQIFIEGPGFSYRVSPGVVHRFCAPFNDCVLMEISTDHPEDIVRIKDDYCR